MVQIGSHGREESDKDPEVVLLLIKTDKSALWTRVLVVYSGYTGLHTGLQKIIIKFMI